MAEIFNFYVQDNRSIQFPKANLLEPIMQEDHNVAVWRFRIPKVLNDIDMSAWAWWFVYVNAKGQKFTELLTLVDDIDEPDEYCTADYSIDYGVSYNPGSFAFSLESVNADVTGAILQEWHTKTYHKDVDRTLQGNQAKWSETESDIISALIVTVQNKVSQLVGGATPEPVSLIADMTDTSKVYLYVGEEDGESTGYWYHYNGSAWVAGGLYASGITVDAVPTQGSTNAVSSGGVYEALASKVAKPLTSPNGTNGQLLRTNGDGTTEWTDFAAPTDEQVGGAVSEWLDDHPEATTTVQDGSLTKEKFSPMLTMQAIKDYVTPQMYGAKADGETDDTEAIQTALDSGLNVYFPTGTYMTSGVSITRTMHLYFDEVTLKANTANQDFVISTNKRIQINGSLRILGDRKAFIGFKFTDAYQSEIEHLYVERCNAWGVYITSGGAMNFRYLQANYCGTKMGLTVSGTGASSRTVNIDTDLSEDYATLLNSEYATNMFGYDASGYDGGRYTKLGRMFDSFDNNAKTLTLKVLAPNKLPADYLEKSFVLCFGGGLLIGTSTHMQLTVQMYNSIGNSTGITFGATYGSQIVNYYSQSDGIPIFVPSYAQGNHISSITVEGEAANSGYIAASYNYDCSVIDVISTNGNGTFQTSKLLAFGSADQISNNAVPFLKSTTRRCVPRQFDLVNVTLSELTSDVICADRTKTFTINLIDKYNGASSYNFWGVKTIYFMPRVAQNNNITITLHNDTANAGFSLEGATNNVLTIARPSSTAEFKLIIVLKNSTFKVYMENMPSLVTPVS